jgi:cell division protein ZapE
VAAVERLDALRRALENAARDERSLRRRLRARLGGATRPAVRGAYLWGGVGRGKTFLMDLFHASLAVPARRTHFHRFMHDVHGRLRELRDQTDPLRHVAGDVAAGCRVLCFDELYVTDVADAMILAGLFGALVEAGVTLVITSNAAPRDLYRDGLQRQRFVPAIELIERNADVINVDAGTDYRLRQLERAPLYISTKTYDADRLLAQRFEAIAGDAGEAGGVLEVEGREIPLRQRHVGVVWFDFAALCDGPRSQADYIEIARSFHTVVISGVPRFDAARDDEARRFISLVDEFYDRGVKLVASAEGPPTSLYQGERLAFEFQRTASRLTEMQTHAYLERPHRP